MVDQGPSRSIAEIPIAAPVQAVWDAIRDPAVIRNWFGWDAPGLADEIAFIFGQHGGYDEAKRTVRFEGTPDSFTLAGSGDGTIVHIDRAEPETETGAHPFDEMSEGWVSFVEQLRFGIERHALGPRRTIYLAGQARAEGASPIRALDLAGLHGDDAAPAGPVTLATGDTADGVRWHRTRWQVGVAMPQWGDGLLIACDQPATDQAPAGRGAVILTTYGLDDAAFAALDARWRDWWAERFDPVPPPGGG